VDWNQLAHNRVKGRNELAGSIKGGGTLDQVSDNQLLKKDTTPRS
jgi:hypothetical protein